MKTVALYTLGCKVSQYETEAIAEGFEARSFRVVSFTDVADVYVINTCTVTAESDRKSRQIIRRAHKTNPDALIMKEVTLYEEVYRRASFTLVGQTER